MQEAFREVGLFWVYVERFHLLFYKYFYGSGADADGRGAIATDGVWWQQFVITDVRIRPVPERTYSQRPTIIRQRKLKQ